MYADINTNITIEYNENKISKITNSTTTTLRCQSILPDKMKVNAKKKLK